MAAVDTLISAPSLPTRRAPRPATETGPTPAPATGVRIAYLLSQYPAVSHTFFLYEVLGLRARGLHIETASIRAADRPLDVMPDIEADEARNTRYIKPGSWFEAAGELFLTAFTAPGVLLRGLLAVFTLPRLTLSRRFFWLLYLAEALLVGRWMKQRKLNHLHVHFGNAVASVGLLVSKAWKIPFSITIHGPEELLNHEAFHVREKISAASFVICISHFCRSQLYQLMPSSTWDKFQVVRLGVNPVTLAPQRTPAAGANVGGYVPERVLELVSTGRMVPQKGHRILLEALKILRDRGLALKATLIGGGPELKALRQYVADNDLEDRVAFTAALSHPQTIAYLRRADMFALASFAEGIPVALMEAMSLGLPCVGTQVAGIPELIRPGQDGLLVPPASAQALADALAALILDPALRKQLGSAARQRILGHYNLPLNQELLVQTFEQQFARLYPDAALAHPLAQSLAQEQPR